MSCKDVQSNQYGMRDIIKTIARDIRNAMLLGILFVKREDLTFQALTVELCKSTLYFNVLAILQLMAVYIADGESQLSQIIVLGIFYALQKFVLANYFLVAANFVAMEIYIYFFYFAEYVATTFGLGACYFSISLIAYHFSRDRWRTKWLK